MKNTCLSLFVLWTIVSSGCKRTGNDEPQPTTPQNPLALAVVGTWKPVFEAEDVNGNGVPDESEKEFSTDGSSLSFNSDGTGSLKEEFDQLAVNLRWSVTDNMLAVLFQEDDSTWNTEDADTLYIINVNATEMLLRNDEMSAKYFVGLIKQ